MSRAIQPGFVGGANPPVNTVAPVISGTVGTIGATLSCTTGTWTGTPAPTFSYQWKRDGSSIGGATSSTYVQDKNDIGPSITCVVTATNPAGAPTATSNSLAYVPTADVLEWLDPSTLTPGLVSSWPGVKGTWTPTASGAQRPTASATSLNSTPGVTGDGSGNVMSGTHDLSAIATSRVVAALVDTATATSIAIEHAGGATDGLFGCYLNLSANGDLAGQARGTSGYGECRTDTTHGVSSAKVVSWGFDTSITKGVQFIRENGSSLSLTTVLNACGAGNFANSSTTLFARSGPVAPWAGTLGVVAVMSGIAEDAALDRVERFCAYRAGIAVW